MGHKSGKISRVLGNRSQTQGQLQRLRQAINAIEAPAADRVRSDLSATIHHLTRQPDDHPIVVVVGGTGTGKSTVVNRLLDAELSATSFRRTYTAGPVAILKRDLPSGFAALTHVQADTAPAKGQSDRVTLVSADRPVLDQLTLIDTPDIDGEITEHHGVADRVFRWADAVVFLVTPEKYQMPELQPYYRLAQRYGIPSLHVLNKADEPEVVADYATLLSRSGIASATVLAIARDDATWQPSLEQSLTTARIEALKIAVTDQSMRARISDVVSRINDQLLGPMLDQRTRVDRAILAIRSMAGDAVEVDVHPLTQQLQRRLREKSVLYLIGPQRMLDRVRSVPSMLVRLPGSMWSWTKTGQFKLPGVDDTAKAEAPDFRSIVVEQFQSLQSRIDDVLSQSLPVAASDWKFPADQAAAIAEDELAQLRTWLETRWNATPRDTAVLNKLLKVIPGANKLNQYSEAAPYLLAIACVTHGAFFGHLDLLILGGYSAVTWLTEKLSDEVASKTRNTNKQIAERYEKLARDQIDRVITWLERQAPSRAQLNEVRGQLEAFQ